MSKPHKHAQSSARKFGGTMEDYLEIHVLLDSSKMAMADNRHRALTHNSWFINHILPKIFGQVITNSEGKEVSVIDVAEQHLIEDFAGRFIPTAQDYLEILPMQSWMNGRGVPKSKISIEQQKESVFYTFNPEEKQIEND